MTSDYVMKSYSEKHQINGERRWVVFGSRETLQSFHNRLFPDFQEFESFFRAFELEEISVFIEEVAEPANKMKTL